jgi:hypothetical protein
MRKLAVLALALVIMPLCVVTPADAEGSKTCTPSQSGPPPPQDSLDCLGNQNSDSQTNASLAAARPSSSGTTSLASSSGSGPVTRYVPYNRLSTGPDGQPCAATGYVAEGTTPPDERLLVDPNPRETNIPLYGSDLRILETYPPCPDQPRAPGQPAPVETRSMVAARYWERIPLPKPQPSIAPGRAITGKLAYLETRGEIIHTYTNDTVFGPLQIVATGSYTVTWGDGETSGPHSIEGRPWPGGQITHEYLKIGAYNIVVTEKWTAHWSLDGESGTLRTLQTTGAINNFPVEQIQAVIGR